MLSVSSLVVLAGCLRKKEKPVVQTTVEVQKSRNVGGKEIVEITTEHETR